MRNYNECQRAVRVRSGLHINYVHGAAQKRSPESLKGEEILAGPKQTIGILIKDQRARIYLKVGHRSTPPTVCFAPSPLALWLVIWSACFRHAMNALPYLAPFPGPSIHKHKCRPIVGLREEGTNKG